MLHRLAIMSKDGDWVLREDEETVHHVLDVLAGRGARYRFGAPLDVRWLAGGWSAHLEHWRDGLRLRTDFVTRPPRISGAERDRLWQNTDTAVGDVVALEPLALARVAEGRDALDEALDRERRALMRADEARLAVVRAAAEAWASVWPEVSRETDLPLHAAHRIVTSRAEGLLPFAPSDGESRA